MEEGKPSCESSEESKTNTVEKDNELPTEPNNVNTKAETSKICTTEDSKTIRINISKSLTFCIEKIKDDTNTESNVYEHTPVQTIEDKTINILVSHSEDLTSSIEKNSDESTTESTVSVKTTEDETKNIATSIPKLSSSTEDMIDKEKTEDSIEDKKPEEPEYDAKNVHYEGDIAIYTDPKSGYQYKWCNETEQWLAKETYTYGFEDDTHIYTDAEGVKYFWDAEKSAWFPKIDDEFMARYQMSYGFLDSKENSQEELASQESKKVEEKKEKEKGMKRKVEAPLPSWFDVDDEQNTKVYVNNLPTDITEAEFVELMQKCGLVMRDVHTGKMKIKLYMVPNTEILKGDGLCTYIKIESVDLALKLLDGYVYRGKQLQVERAKFQMKGKYDPTLKPKKKKKDKEKLKKLQNKLFDWRPEKMRGERSKHERVVIVKNLFEPTLFDREVSLILEYQQDLREECGKVGEVKKVILYDRHPEGVAQITMSDPDEADACITLLNGRWFGQRKLTAEIWNGKTKFKIAETDSEISKRLDNWDKYLEADDANKGTSKVAPHKTEKTKEELSKIAPEKSEETEEELSEIAPEKSEETEEELLEIAPEKSEDVEMELSKDV